VVRNLNVSIVTRANGLICFYECCSRVQSLNP
jgi:hypothetical protein